MFAKQFFLTNNYWKIKVCLGSQQTWFSTLNNLNFNAPSVDEGGVKVSAKSELVEYLKIEFCKYNRENPEMSKITKSFLFVLCAALLTVGFFNTAAYSQSNKGSIVGTIKDPGDAVVPDAKITVTNNATGEAVEVNSSGEGEFTVTNLDPGNYKVTIEGSGFKTLLLSSVTVETNARVPVDAKFTEVSGSGDNLVTITADSAPLVESETSVRGDVITGREVTDLPIGQRNFTVLAALSPGVNRPQSAGFGIFGGGNEANPPNFPSAESARFRESGGSAISSNGARVTQNEFLLDGVDNNESQFRQIAIFPNPDAIKEFKIETSVPSAELGRAGGAIISTTLKSGGNLFHGSAFEFYQGRFASAVAAQYDENNNPANSQGIRPRQIPNYVSHNFGGTIGGPIYFLRPGEGTPTIYDGRNRTFFFFDYAGQRGFIPATEGDGNFINRIPVPTARQRLGDFSQLLRPGTSRTYTLAGGGTVVAPIGTIFDPNGVPIPGNDLRNCATCGAFSNFARNYVNAFPLPTFDVPGENYSVNRVVQPTQDVYGIRIDHRLFEGNNIFGRYSRVKQIRVVDNFFPLGSSPNGNDLPAGPSAGDILGDSRAAVIGDTQTFGSNVVNDFRFGYTRVEIGILNTGVFGTGGFDPNVTANLGAPNINVNQNSSGIVLVGIVDTLGGGDRATEFTGDGGPFLFRSDNFNVADAVTVVRGNNVFRFGADIRFRQNRNIDGGRNGAIKGNYQYGTTGDGFVSGNYNGIGPNDTGSALANFLLGYQPGFYTRGTPGTDALQTNKEIAFFVQDDWKATQALTLNLGLRYDLFAAPVERFDRISNFDPASGNIIVAGENSPNGRDLVNNDKNNFGPRVGFAYSGFSENKSLVLRGGYGIVYSVDTNDSANLNTNPGNGGGSFNCNPITNPAGCNSVPGLTGRYLFDRGVPLPNESFAARGSTFAAPTDRTILYVNPDRKDALFHQYNLTLQYGFWKDWLAEIAYVGATGRNLQIVRNIGSGNDPGAPGTRQIANIANVIETNYLGDFSYNALQSKLEKRLSNGLSLLTTYTFAKALDTTPGGFCLNGAGQRNCGPDNPLDLENDRGLSDTDVRHRVNIASVFDLPVGRNRRFLGDAPNFIDYVIGGWQLNTIINLQSGPVYDVTSNGARVNIIGDPTPTAQQRAEGRQLNINAFAQPSQRVFVNDPNSPLYGSLGRNAFRGEFQEYFDASLFKNIPLRFINEEAKFEIRISAFNVFNHVNRGRPNADLNNAANFGKDFGEQRRRQLEFGGRFVF